MDTATISDTEEPDDAYAPIEYKCSVDGKVFLNRDNLLRYAKKKFPDRVDEIMSKYPVLQ